MISDSSTRTVTARQMTTAPLFAGLDDADLSAVLDHAQLVDVPTGAEVVREGAAGADFIVLLTGELSVSLSLGKDGDMDVGSVRPGGSLGEIAALLGEARTATAVAAMPSRVLRIDASALESLFTRSPRLGVALSRELARGLKAALALKNDLQADVRPDTVTLAVPDVSRLRDYMTAYYASAVKNVLKQHRLIVDRRFPVYEVPFRLSEDERARWYRLFDAPMRGPVVPFTFYTTVGTLTLMRVVEDVGVNFKNLMHLRSEMFLAPQALACDVDYMLRVALEDIVVLQDTRVALVVESRLSTGAGARVQTCRDFFVILNLEPGYVEALRNTKGFGHRDLAELRGLAKRQPQLGDSPGSKRHAIDVPEDMGMRYGKVSGDLNMVHTTAFAARLFGHERAFVQGLCTANHALACLANADADAGPLQEFRISFSRRVFTGQRIEFVHTDSAFEWLDGKGALLAFGDFTRAPQIRA
jgi:CRP-like cAMP-binding protein